MNVSRETDIMMVDNSGLVESQLSGIAGGILDLLDDTHPDSSGTVKMAPEEVVEPEVEEQEEVVEETPEPEPPKSDKFVIKWEGEDKEVSQEELLELAQKGFDYTRKTQRIAEERNELAPYIGLANKIKSDPNLANQISALIAGQPIVQAAPKIVSDDPVEQLKYEMKQEIMAEMEQKLQKTVAPMNKQQALDRVRMQVQTDPMFKDVQADIVKMVQAQPKALQRNMFLQLDQDPAAYLQAFEHFKKIRQSSNPVESVAAPKPVATKTKAPILEAGGVSQPQAINNKEKKEKLTKQKAKALRSGDTMELASWLQDSGALEHLY